MTKSELRRHMNSKPGLVIEYIDRIKAALEYVSRHRNTAKASAFIDLGTCCDVCDQALGIGNYNSDGSRKNK